MWAATPQTPGVPPAPAPWGQDTKQGQDRVQSLGHWGEPFWSEVFPLSQFGGERAGMGSPELSVTGPAQAPLAGLITLIK